MVTSHKPPQAVPEMLTTEEFALFQRNAPQTVRKNVSQSGHHNGIKPVKLPNGRLLWRKTDLDALLRVEA